MTHEGKSRSAMLKIEINTWYIHSVLLPAEVFYFPTSGQGDDVYQNLIFAGVQKNNLNQNLI